MYSILSRSAIEPLKPSSTPETQPLHHVSFQDSPTVAEDSQSASFFQQSPSHPNPIAHLGGVITPHGTGAGGQGHSSFTAVSPHGTGKPGFVSKRSSMTLLGGAPEPIARKNSTHGKHLL